MSGRRRVRLRSGPRWSLVALALPIAALGIGAVYYGLGRLETRTIVCDHRGADGDACHLMATGPVTETDERIATSDIAEVRSASYSAGRGRWYYTLEARIRGADRTLQDHSSADVTQPAAARLISFVQDPASQRTTIVLQTPDWVLAVLIALLSIPFFAMGLYVLGLAVWPAVVGRLVPEDEL